MTAVVVLVSMCAIGAAGVASASAHEFKASKAGTLKGKQLNNLRFKSATLSFECTAETSEGKVVAGSQETLKQMVNYHESCSIEGFVTTVTTADYGFSAGGSLTPENSLIVKALAWCTITINPQKAIKTVEYKNLAGGKLEIKSALSGIAYETSGLCGKKSETDGLETANTEVELEGGTVEWK
jgi:hypothetical protein